MNLVEGSILNSSYSQNAEEEERMDGVKVREMDEEGKRKKIKSRLTLRPPGVRPKMRGY